MKRVFHLIAIGLVFSGVAAAEPERRSPQRPAGPDAGRPGKPGKPVRPDESWRLLDADGDGQVCYREFAGNERLQRMPEEARRQIFGRLDKNGDGAIQEQEMAPRGHKNGTGGERRRPMWLGDMDRNRDGAISFEEFRGGRMVARVPEPKQREMFDRMDRDGNGRLDRADHMGGFHGGMPRLADLDTDKSGGVNFEEFSVGKMAQKVPKERRREMFDRFDRNGDGELSPKDTHGPGSGPGREPSRGGQGGGFESLDADGDKVLSFDEFRKAPWLRSMDEDAREDRFEELDQDGDLKLTPDEIGAGMKRNHPRSGARPDGKGPERRAEGQGPERRRKPPVPAGPKANEAI